MFVTPEDFRLIPFSIASLDSPEVEETLQAFIDQKEEDCLTEILGDILYEEFMAGLITEEQKWLDLRDGVQYEDEEGKKFVYKGVKAFLIPYIYSKWLEEYVHDNTGDTGNLQLEGENSNTIPVTIKIIKAQNDYAHQICSFVYWPKKSTLYHYLNTFPEDYPDFVENCPELLNEFDF